MLLVKFQRSRCGINKNFGEKHLIQWDALKQSVCRSVPDLFIFTQFTPQWRQGCLVCLFNGDVLCSRTCSHISLSCARFQGNVRCQEPDIGETNFYVLEYQKIKNLLQTPFQDDQTNSAKIDRLIS